MAKKGYRVEKDSMGEMYVPETAYWGAQTQRAVENFPISGYRFRNQLHNQFKDERYGQIGERGGRRQYLMNRGPKSK